MINFSLSDEQKAFQDLARKFAKEVMAPQAAHFDETMEYPWPIIKAAHEAGLMNTHIPQEYGGLGLSVFDGCLISEELAAACSVWQYSAGAVLPTAQVAAPS